MDPTKSTLTSVPSADPTFMLTSIMPTDDPSQYPSADPTNNITPTVPSVVPTVQSTTVFSSYNLSSIPIKGIKSSISPTSNTDIVATATSTSKSMLTLVAASISAAAVMAIFITLILYRRKSHKGVKECHDVELGEKSHNEDGQDSLDGVRMYSIYSDNDLVSNGFADKWDSVSKINNMRASKHSTISDNSTDAISNADIKISLTSRNSCKSLLGSSRVYEEPTRLHSFYLNNRPSTSVQDYDIATENKTVVTSSVTEGSDTMTQCASLSVDDDETKTCNISSVEDGRSRRLSVEEGEVSKSRRGSLEEGGGAKSRRGSATNARRRRGSSIEGKESRRRRASSVELFLSKNGIELGDIVV